jgi:hypothetical protein
VAAAVLVVPALVWLALEGRAYPPLERHQAGDYAKIELYTRLAAEGSLRVGAESRFHVHQPGPMFFYAAAPIYKLMGGTTKGMAAAALVWNMVFLVLVLRSASRLAPGSGPFVAAVLLGVFVHARGIGFLLSPWNPHVGMLPFGLALLAGARLATGEGRALPLLALATTAVVQCQMAWGLPMVLVVGTGLILCLWPRGRRRLGIPTDGQGLSRSDLVAALLVSSVLWVLPVVDEIVGDYRNFHRILAMSERQRSRAPRPWTDTLPPSVRALNLRRDGLPPIEALSWGWRDRLDPRMASGRPLAWVSARDRAWAVAALGSLALAGGLAWRRRSPAAALAVITAVGLVSLPLVVRYMPGKRFPPYLYQWAAMLTLVALLALGTELLARVPRLRALARGWPGAVLLLTLPVLLLSDAVRAQAGRSESRDARSVAFERIARDLRARVEEDLPGGRRFLIRVAPGARQGTVIGLILAFDKSGLRFRVEPFGSCRIEGRFTPRGDEWGELLIGDLPPLAGSIKLGEPGGVSVVWQLPWRTTPPVRSP